MKQDIIENALKYGIKVLKNNQFVVPNGIIALTYEKNLKQFILVYGTNSIDAGYVLLSDYSKTWVVNN